jgi:phosphoribosylformimino-5-aminoimidazole carboxamide ribotide isomerase
MLLIPSIDIQQGRCVRLQQGKFDRVSVYDVDPASLAIQYAKLGVKQLHLVDLDGAKSGSPQQLELMKTMQQHSGLTIQAGGGIRSIQDAKALLAVGMSRIVLGSLAITDPSLVLQLFDELGADKIILALDVCIENSLPKPVINGWQTKTEGNLWDLVTFYQRAGLSTILCTDISKDGMMLGPNFSLYEEALQRFPDIAWQASGGLRNQEDINRLSSMGLSAAILGRMLYETEFSFGSCFAGEVSC